MSNFVHKYPMLDILRGIAVLLVFGRHMEIYPEELSLFWHTVTSIWQRGGWVGVDLFFVQSGFLIAGILFQSYAKAKDIPFKRFLLRRGMKIYPSLALMVLVMLIATFFLGRSVEINKGLIELLFVQNYFRGLTAHTWTLAVEWHFYIILPLLFALLVRMNKRAAKPFESIPMICFIVCGSILAARILTANLYEFNFFTHFFPTHLRLDALFSGVLIAYFYHYHQGSFLKFSERYRYALLFGGVLFLIPAFCFNLETTPFIYTFGFTFFYLSSGLFLIALIQVKPRVNFITKSMLLVGVHSYSIYVWHILVGFFMRHFVLPDFGWVFYFGGYFFGCLFFGIMMSKILEFPMLKIRNRLYPLLGVQV